METRSLPYLAVASLMIAVWSGDVASAQSVSQRPRVLLPGEKGLLEQGKFKSTDIWDDDDFKEKEKKDKDKNGVTGLIAEPQPTSGGVLRTFNSLDSGARIGSQPPTADADVKGMWSELGAWPFIALHANVLPNGRVLTYGTPVGSGDLTVPVYDEWDPAQGFSAGSHRLIQNTTGGNGGDYADSFCSISKLMSNGVLLIVGGNSADDTSYWDTNTATFGVAPTPLTYPRWYASVVRLADGRVVTVGGEVPGYEDAHLTPDDNSQISITPEIYTEGVGWSVLAGGTSASAYGARDNRWWYPKAYLMPNGNVFGISHDVLWTLNPVGTGSTRVVGRLSTSNKGISATSVMYDKGKILIAGGGQRVGTDITLGSRVATTIDINEATPVIRRTGDMRVGRNWATAAVLPDGKVLLLGGSRRGNQGGNDGIKSGEIWNPATGVWTLTAQASENRLYHSTAALLPDGSVLTAGDGPEDDVTSGQVFYPPYLFTRSSTGAVSWATRPNILSASTTPGYGKSVIYKAPVGQTIASVSAISLAAVTHSHNSDQRRVPLQFSQTQQDVRVVYPTQAALLPPGYYQLHLVNTAGVPSVGSIIEIKRP